MRYSQAIISACSFWVILTGCSVKQSENTSSVSTDDVVGTWLARWQTDPASYPDVDSSIQFTMNGQFRFDKKGKVTISAYGHEKCIFSSDTLTHSLNWKLSNDTLQLVNENDIHGMAYTVLNLNSSQMKLQLMDDIFLELTKQ